MDDDRLHYEATPGGGVRVQGGGIELKVSREAIERAEQEGGLGYNVALTPGEHYVLDRRDEFESPIREIMNFTAVVEPRNPQEEFDA